MVEVRKMSGPCNDIEPGPEVLLAAPEELGLISPCAVNVYTSESSARVNYIL